MEQEELAKGAEVPPTLSACGTGVTCWVAYAYAYAYKRWASLSDRYLLPTRDDDVLRPVLHLHVAIRVSHRLRPPQGSQAAPPRVWSPGQISRLSRDCKIVDRD